MASKDDLLSKTDFNWESIPLQELQVPEKFISKSPSKNPPGIMAEFDFNKMEWIHKWEFPEGFRFLEYVSCYLYPDNLVKMNYRSSSEIELVVHEEIRLAGTPPVSKFIIKYYSKN